MKSKFLGVILSVLCVSSLTFAQGTGSVHMQINDSGVSMTSDQGSVTMDENGVSMGYKDGKCFFNGKPVPCDKVGEGIEKGLSVFFIFVAFMSFVFGVIGLGLFILWIVALVHAIDKPIENKGIWIVVLILTGGIGAIFYYFLVMRPFNKVNKSTSSQNQVTQQQNSLNQ